MELTVAIPSRGRNELLKRLLDALSRQSIQQHRFEVLVGLDGQTPPASQPDSRAFARLIQLSHRGPAATRNALIEQAKGHVILFLNDDVTPAPDLLEHHIRAHEGISPADLVLGSAPWFVPQSDTVFDRLIRETSLVFFYDRMDRHDASRDPNKDWGFRHAWTLNLSLRTENARRIRFEERLPRAMFEDLEWGYRLAHTLGSRVLYRPEAVVTHDHRYTLAGYLGRERHLGGQSLALAEINPDCAHAVFGRDVRDPGFIRECSQMCAQEQETCDALAREIEELASKPSNSVTDIKDVYQRFLPLKRHTWRQGVIEEAVRLGLVSTLAA